MRKHIVRAGMAILLFTLGGAAWASAGWATAAQRPLRATPLAVTLSHKVTLNETSIDGPGFSSVGGTFEGVTTSSTVIAWTGTDSLHHLNLMTTADRLPHPLRFGHKLTLPETSFARPAVVQMSEPAGGTVIIAWTGTDSGHTLNVLWNAYGAPDSPQKKLTLWGETSLAAPGLTLFNGNLLLSWTGTDPNHSLNVLPLSPGSLARGTKTVLPQFSSSAGPNLGELLTWTTPTQHLNLASSSDGVHFTSALGAGGLPQLSASGPDALFTPREGGPEYWLAWTGTDLAHYLNVQWTTHYPQWPDPASTKTVLGDTALGGPQIAFNSGFLIAWTGTDSAHHLNVAEFEGV